MTRTDVSAPTRFLIHNNFLFGSVLHYGEGKAYMDTDAIDMLPDVTSVYAYDPHSEHENRHTLPNSPEMFDITVCNYVLNTLAGQDREDAFIGALIHSFSSFITVRLDKVNGEPYDDGVMTSKGTFQAQLTSEQWIIWFYETLHKRTVAWRRLRVVNKTRNYLMVEVW